MYFVQQTGLHQVHLLWKICCWRKNNQLIEVFTKNPGLTQFYLFLGNFLVEIRNFWKNVLSMSSSASILYILSGNSLVDFHHFPEKRNYSSFSSYSCTTKWGPELSFLWEDCGGCEWPKFQISRRIWSKIGIYFLNLFRIMWSGMSAFMKWLVQNLLSDLRRNIKFCVYEGHRISVTLSYLVAKS